MKKKKKVLKKKRQEQAEYTREDGEYLHYLEKLGNK